MLLNQSQGPLSKLLAFICGIIKMLHKLVSGFLSLLASFPFCHMGGLLFPLVSQQVEAVFAYSELVEILSFGFFFANTICNHLFYTHCIYHEMSDIDIFFEFMKPYSVTVLYTN